MLWALALVALASEPVSESEAQLRLTAMDLPYQAVAKPWAPSMQQSLDLTYGIDRLAVLGTREGMEALSGGDPGLLYGLGFPILAGVNLGLLYSTSAWMHEEWHRAVMSNQQIGSRNGWYVPSTWSGGLIPVDSVSDADLGRLKRENPAETVRLMVAGQESQHALGDRIADELFLHGGEGSTLGPLYRSETWMGMTIQFQELGNLSYLLTCAGEGSDALTDSENQQRLTVPERDFTGLDCTAWMYDMRRPDEPYAGRGAHPYGEGVDRYRSAEDLTEGERRALRQQALLHLVNLANPHLYYIDGFDLGDGNRWVASAGHQTTPFGYLLELRVGLKVDGLAGVARLRNHIWRKGWLPEVDVQLVDLGLDPTRRLQLQLGGAVWLQPTALRWDAEGARPGGLLRSGLSWRAAPAVDLFVEAEGKSTGWIQGVVALDPSVAVRAGVVLQPQ